MKYDPEAELQRRTLEHSREIEGKDIIIKALTELIRDLRNGWRD